MLLDYRCLVLHCGLDATCWMLFVDCCCLPAACRSFDSCWQVAAGCCIADWLLAVACVACLQHSDRCLLLIVVLDGACFLLLAVWLLAV